MEKRGDGGEVVKYLIIAAVIIFVIFFGYGVVQKFIGRACSAEIAQFEIDLKDLDKAVKPGSVKEFTTQVPCDADEIYFFDLNKKISLDFLSHLPLLKDSVESKAEKNIFLVKGDKVISSFYAGNLDISYPNYVCFLPKFEKINFFVEGGGSKAAIFPGCLQPECTFIPFNATDRNAADIIREGKEFGENFFCENCPRETISEFAKFVQARENIDIFRKYEYCKAAGKLNVEITIKPKDGARLKNFRYYESIPKKCIDDLQKYLSNVEGEVSIKYDPLIIWSLADLNKEEKISYVLDTILDEECKNAIVGIGAGDIVKGKIVPVPEIPGARKLEGTEKNAPIIKNLPDRTIGFLEQEQLVIPDLWSYASDKDIGSENLGYSIARQTNSNAIECSIKSNKEVWCSTKQNKDAISDISIEVFDGELTAQDTFRIAINPLIICGNGIIEGIEVCDDRNGNNGDGCSSACQIEVSWACSNEPSECVLIKSAVQCGDGVCNTVSGESCSICPQDCGACQKILKFATLTCRQSVEKCGFFGSPCDTYQKSEKTGWCLPPVSRKYLCYNEWKSASCAENPTCRTGYQVYSIESCCTSQASAVCYENDAYWQDSCGVMETKKEECGTTATTSELRCSNDLLQREKINRGCSSGQCTQVQEWITEQNCAASGQICDSSSRSCITQQQSQSNPGASHGLPADTGGSGAGGDGRGD